MRTNLSITKLHCEYETNPVGIEVGEPRLSWQLVSNRRQTRQSAYRVLVADSLAQIEKDLGNLWDSQRVSSDQSIQVEYDGAGLQASRRYYWKVMVWDTRDIHTSWWRQVFLPLVLH